MSAIRFTVEMFNSQCLPVYAFSLHPRNLRHTEAFRPMSSVTSSSADFEHLALPLFASLYNHALLAHPQSSRGRRPGAGDLLQGTPRLRYLSTRHQLQGLDLPHPPQHLPHYPHRHRRLPHRLPRRPSRRPRDPRRRPHSRRQPHPARQPGRTSHCARPTSAAAP